MAATQRIYLTTHLKTGSLTADERNSGFPYEFSYYLTDFELGDLGFETGPDGVNPHMEKVLNHDGSHSMTSSSTEAPCNVFALSAKSI